MTKNRVQYIDRLKGVAILAVIVSHTTIWTFNHPNDPISDVMASFMMPVFMFLSGVVVSAPPNLGKLIKKTIALVLPALSIGLTYSLSFGSPPLSSFGIRLSTAIGICLY